MARVLTRSRLMYTLMARVLTSSRRAPSHDPQLSPPLPLQPTGSPTSAEQVGVEGTIECVLLLAVLFPTLQASGGEDVLAAAHAIADEPLLLCLGLATCLCLAVYNPLSQSVAALDGTVLRQVRCGLLRISTDCFGLPTRHRSPARHPDPEADPPRTRACLASLRRCCA